MDKESVAVPFKEGKQRKCVFSGSQNFMEPHVPELFQQAFTTSLQGYYRKHWDIYLLQCFLEISRHYVPRSLRRMNGSHEEQVIRTVRCESNLRKNAHVGYGNPFASQENQITVKRRWYIPRMKPWEYRWK